MSDAKCEHCTSDGTGAAHACDFLKRQVEGEVCAICSKNTAKGIWPKPEQVRRPQSITIGATFIGPPRPPVAPEVIARRREVCAGCESNQGITEKMGAVRVKCSKCTTCEGGRSLTAAGQACPVGKW